MATLTGQTIANSYKDLLQVSNSNSGVDGTIRIVEDGEGTSSALKIGTGGIESSGTLTVAGVTTINSNLNVNGNLNVQECVLLEAGGDALFQTAIIVESGGLEVQTGSGQIGVQLGGDPEGGTIMLRKVPSSSSDPVLSIGADDFGIYGRDDNHLYFLNDTGDPYKIVNESMTNIVFPAQVTITDIEESDKIKIGYLIDDPGTQGTQIDSDHGNLWLTSGDAKIKLKNDDSGNKRVIFDGTYGTLHQSPLEMDTGQNILVSGASKIKDSDNGDEWIKLNGSDGIQIKSEGVGELYIESLDCKLEIADTFTVDCNEGILIRDFAGTHNKRIKLSLDDPSAVVVRRKSATALQLYDEASNLMLNYNTNWDGVSGPYTSPSDTGVLDIGKLVVGNLDGASLGSRTLPNDLAQVRINLRNEVSQAFTIYNDAAGDNIFQIDTDDTWFLFDEAGSGWKFSIGAEEPQGNFHVKAESNELCHIMFEASASEEIKIDFHGSGSNNGIYFDNSTRAMTFESGGDTLTKIQNGDGIQKQEQDGSWYQLLSRGFFFQTFVHNCDAYTISSGDFNLIPWTANGNMENTGAGGLNSTYDVDPEFRFLVPYSSMRLVKIVVQPEDNTCTSYPTTVELRLTRRQNNSETTANPNNTSSMEFEIGSWTTAPDGIGDVPAIVWEQDIDDMSAYSMQNYTQGMQIIMELIVNGTLTNNNGWLISTVWAIKL